MRDYQIRSYDPSSFISGYPDIVSRILAFHNINTKDEAEEFLNPSYEKISDPYCLNDMKLAVKRILLAIKKNEKIVLYGDYDADGIPGVALLYDFFCAIGYKNISVYIPHRHDEGYGFHHDAITEFLENGISLVITVDVGITAPAEVLYAKENGIDVIITDHHIIGEDVPKACAIVHPKLGKYLDKMICGSATAFQLVRGILIHIRSLKVKDIPEGIHIPNEGWEKWLLDLVGIATISDMVPLVKENRIFANYGLRVLQKTRRLGLRALAKMAGVSIQNCTEDDVSFSLTPRLNAASRMDDPRRAFELLTATDTIQAETLANFLVKKNDERKYEVATIMRSVHTKLSSRELREIVVVGDPSWSQGVLGLVASKITEEYSVTAFVLAHHNNGTLKGSCRANHEVDVTALMSSLSPETFLYYGGHQGAGGFSLTRDRIHTLENELYAQYLIQKEASSNSFSSSRATLIDGIYELSSLTKEVCKQVFECAPFGVGNPKPILALRGTFKSIKGFGKGNIHTEVTMKSSDSRIWRAVGFFALTDSYTYMPHTGEEVYVIGSLERSWFRGREEIRLRIIDILQSSHQVFHSK